MSTTDLSATSGDSTIFFASLAALKTAHIALLEQRRVDGDTSAVLANVAQFIYRGSATGVLLEADEDRWAGQSVLDYWANVLYRAGYEIADAALADFDPLLTPELDDALCPYIGLDPFRELTHALFFGRQRLIGELVERLRAQHLLAVIGPSGSGKSSLVTGGLVPALKSGALPGSAGWRYLPPIVPGSDPLAALNRLVGVPESDEWNDPQRLRRLIDGASDAPTVLVIDQFEELFTLCDDRTAREIYIANLLALIDDPDLRHLVVLTMRSDFETFVVRLPDLQPLWEQATARVVPLNAAELREAIEQPADLVGLKFEPGVVDALLGDILGEPAALPLLQFTLLKLWEHRERNRVTWDDYTRLGGGRLALARSADAFYNDLIPEDQITARRILLRMVRPGYGLEVTSNRVRREALYLGGEARERIDRVLAKLFAARLVRLTHGDTAADDQLEVAHEALVRNWPKLVGWLEDERFALEVRRRLEAKASDWERLGRGSGGLLDEIQLRDAERWLAGPDAAYLGYNELLQALVQASRARLQAARQAQESRQLELARAQAIADLERRRAEEQTLVTKRTLQVAALLLTLLVLTVAALVFAFRQTTLAQRNATEAQELAIAGGAQAALSKGNTDLALSLALAANQLDQAPTQAQLTLSEAAYAPGTRRRLAAHTAGVQSAAFSPDGKTALSGSRDQTLIVWDLATGVPLRIFRGHTDVVNSVAFSPSGTTALSGASDKTLILWDVSSGQALRTFTGHTDVVNSVAFSPGGKAALSGSNDNTLILWNLTNGQPVRTFTGHTDAVNSVAFSPDSTTALSGANDSTVILWDIATGQALRTFKGHTDAVTSVVFSPDGKTALSGSYDKTLILWDVATGQALRIFHGHAREVFSVAFSPDGHSALSGSRDSRLALWDVATGTLIRYLVGHGAAVQTGTFSRDGQSVISASSDFTVRLWDLRSGAEIRRLEGHTARVIRSVFSPDGKTVLSGSSDKTLILWDVASGEPLRTFTGHTAAVAAVAFSPDGKTALSGSTDQTLILWDVATGQALRTFKGHTAEVSTVAWNPDGKTALSGAGDKMLIVWEIATGKPLHTLLGHTEKVNSAVWSPDGKTILSGSRDASMILWDVASGKPLRTFTGHHAAVRSVAFSPDGKTALSGSEDKTVMLWDVTTGAPLRTFVEHSAAVWSVAFNPNSKTALSASDDNTLIWWDLATGQVIRHFFSHTAAVRTVDFSPNGRRALSGSDDNTLILWRLDTRDELIDWTRANRYIPELTCDQRTIYRLEPLCATP